MSGRRGRRPSVRALAGAVLALAGACAAAQAGDPGEPSQAALESCGEAASQAAMRDCLVLQARASRERLDAAQARAQAALAQWDEDEPHVQRARRHLAASTQAYAGYRQAQCDWAASLGGGAIGAALEMRRLACVISLDAARAGQLDEMTAGLPAR